MPRLPAGPLALAALLAATPTVVAQPAARAPAPTLVVLVTIDQFRADYLDRWRGQLTGGLARLLAGGARFTDAHHDHAITETAPGHATLLSGRFPRSTGIAMNTAGVDDAASPLLGATTTPGASPRRFAGTTLADWLRARDPRSRALSVSLKDRGAILPVGRARSDVYWYTPAGDFTTSRWYRDTLPAWVSAFNGRHLPQRYVGRRWTLLLPDSAYSEPDTVMVEADSDDVTFPHPLPPDSASTASWVRATPFGDEVTVAFALAGVEALGLGAGPQTDLLAVSLSSTDYIGHRFGPDSREMHDQVLRVDRAVGALLDSLYRMRDSSRVLIVLTSDHGVSSIPEVAAATGRQPGATRVALRARLLPVARARLEAAGVDPLAIDVDHELLVVRREAFARAPALADSIVAWFAAEARGMPGVLRVDGYRALLADSLRDPVARRWSHQLPAGVPVELVMTLAAGSSWGGNIASHGSVHDADSHVPLLFAGAGVAPGRYAGFVRTVDIAPTLAALLGVTPSEPLDGVVLRQAIR